MVSEETANTRMGSHEAKLHAILSSAVDCIIIIRDNGSIETVNPAAARLFGYAPEEFIGQNVKFLMPDEHRVKHDGYTQVEFPMIRADIADFLGMTLETVSRTIHMFKAKEIIALESAKSIIVLKPEALLALVEAD